MFDKLHLQYMKLYTCTYFFCAYQLLTSNWFTSMRFSQHKGERKRKIIQEEQERKFSSNNKEVNIYKEITCTWSRANVNPNLVKIKRRDGKKIRENANLSKMKAKWRVKIFIVSGIWLNRSNSWHRFINFP